MSDIEIPAWLRANPDYLGPKLRYDLINGRLEQACYRCATSNNWRDLCACCRAEYRADERREREEP